MNGGAIIVDDSLTVRMDLKEAFEEAGLPARLCGSIAEARTALASEPFSVLVLDILLPDGDGIAFLAEVRLSFSNCEIPVLLLSSEVEVRDRIRGLRTGADEYVGKPYDRAYVVARARELMRRGAPELPSSASVTVLVIDDSLTFREELRGALAGAGYGVVVAASGEDGLRAAAARRPSLILVDAVMPGIDGATVIRRVRLDGALRAVPCVMLTGSDGAGAELQALDAGADAFVRKGDPLDVILAKLAAVLRRASTTTPSDDTASTLGPKKILAVDDSVTYLQALAETLRSDAYEVILAHSGEEALELLAVEAVDCILLDWMMPGLSGRDTCRRIKAAPGVRDVPLLILTAHEEREAMIEGLSAGADDYITKSSEFEILKARVRAQIRRRQLEDEGRCVREELLRTALEAAEARAARDLAETRAALVDELERKNKELEAFSYSVSHDLRAPLRTIDGFSQAVLEDDADRLSDTGREHLNRVRGAAQRMGDLIDGLLDLSRVGRTELRFTQTDLSELAHAIFAELARANPGRTVQTKIEDGIVVHGDTRLLRVVLDNLLGNAWKFTAKTSAPEIEFGMSTKGGQPQYFVRDNGAGFDMAYAKKLFGPFQRLHAESDFPGTGIGLATVHRIVDRHGGRIWAEGAINQGATLFWTLPAGPPGGAR